MRPQRRVARRNLALCLPELPDAKREQILRAHFRSVGITVCETALTWWGSNQRMLSLVRMEGLEHVDRRGLRRRSRFKHGEPGRFFADLRRIAGNRLRSIRTFAHGRRDD